MKKINNEYKKQQYRLAECGRFPLSVSLGRSETKTRGAIVAQSGRSMTEMLGTLAIIGVLSVGAIGGYSYAMNKYRANETIYNVNLCALDLLSQLSNGNTPSEDVWKDLDSVYPISLSTDYAPDHYYIKVSGVPFEVCEMIAQNMPENVEIFVDNDLQACAEGLNTLEFDYEGFNELAEIDAVEDTTCGDEVCGPCEVCSSDGCTSVKDYERACTTQDNERGWCIAGVCEPNAECSCPENQYCTDTNKNIARPNPSGLCADLDYNEYTITFKDDAGNVRTEKWYLSKEYMPSCWDALNFCEALGKRMSRDYKAFFDEATPHHTYTNRLLALEKVAGNLARTWISRYYYLHPATAGYKYYAEDAACTKRRARALCR